MLPLVIHVVPSLAPGGLERLVVEWTNTRNRRAPGITSIACLDEPGLLASCVEGGVVHNLAARRSRFPWDRAAVARLRQMLPVGTGDAIVHSHNPAAQFYAALAVSGAGMAHVHTRHGPACYSRGIVGWVRTRIAWRGTDRAVAVSDATAAALAREEHVAPSRIAIIANGVALSPPAGWTETREREERRRLGFRDDALVVGSVGRLERLKGYDRLLRAFAPVARREKRAVLWLVGDGAERSVLEALARDLGVGDRVRIEGFLTDVRSCLALMDLFVLPSREEGLSVALLEAMAAGIPVAVTEAGASRQVLDGGQCGILLPSAEDAWPDVLASLLGGRGSVAEHARTKAACDRVAAHYSLSGSLDAYEELYRRVLTCRREIPCGS